MAPIDKMEFSELRSGGCITITGKLTLAPAPARVNEELVKHSRADLVALTKERLRNELWRTLYGELERPLDALAYLAMRHAPPADFKRIQEITTHLRDLLAFPSVPDARLQQPKQQQK